MPTDPEPVHGNDSSDDWGSAEERQTDPLKYDPAYLSDRYFYRVVAWSLAGLAGLALIGTIFLAAYDKEIPDFIVAIGSTAVGALAGVLMANRR
jgi:hypothetical protein